MVLEMTGTITVLAPAVIAIGVASFIVKKFDVTIYLSQLQNRQTPTNKLSEKN
jgi:H+/Cl- antiporter ClcA